MERLKQKREEKRWSRAELARRANMHPTDVGRIESGRMKPFAGQLERIAAALGVAVDELVGETANGGR